MSRPPHASSAQFTFSPDPEPLACLVSEEGETCRDGADSFVAQLHKWGFSLAPSSSPGDAEGSGAEQVAAGRTVLKRFRYSSNTTSLHFHDGLIPDLLWCFFSTPLVQRTIPWLTGPTPHAQQAGGSSTFAASGGVHFSPFTCRWHSLQPLEDILVQGHVVRRLREVSGGQDHCTASSVPVLSSDEADDGTARLPLVKRMEVYTPDGHCVSDEFRALCLCVQQRPPCSQRCEGEPHDDDDDEEEDDDADDWSGGLSRRELRRVLPPDVSNEFLYQCVRTFAIGGSAMNQYEDYLDPYLHAARSLFRASITSLQVNRSMTDTDETATRDGVAGLDTDENTCPTSDEQCAAVYTPTVLSRALDIHRIGSRRVTEASGAPTTTFCRVIVNPLERTLVLWAHH